MRIPSSFTAVVGCVGVLCLSQTVPVVSQLDGMLGTIQPCINMTDLAPLFNAVGDPSMSKLFQQLFSMNSSSSTAGVITGISDADLDSACSVMSLPNGAIAQALMKTNLSSSIFQYAASAPNCPSTMKAALPALPALLAYGSAQELVNAIFNIFDDVTASFCAKKDNKRCAAVLRDSVNNTAIETELATAMNSTAPTCSSVSTTSAALGCCYNNLAVLVTDVGDLLGRASGLLPALGVNVSDVEAIKGFKNVPKGCASGTCSDAPPSTLSALKSQTGQTTPTTQAAQSDALQATIFSATSMLITFAAALFVSQ